MLNSISWSEFLTFAALLIAVYYAITVTTYYRTEITAWFRKKEQPINNKVGQFSTLMGATKPEPSILILKQLISAEDLLVNAAPEEELHSASDPIIIGTIADLLQESKILAKTIAQNNTSSDECAALFHSMLQHYPQLNNSTYKNPISISLYHTCKNEAGIEYSLEQINTWWPTDLN